MNRFAIRLAQRSDAEAIADVFIESRRQAMPWLPVLHSREDTLSYFADHVLPHETVIVATVNQVLVGFIAMEHDHGDHLYIAPANQGHGIGNRLLAAAKRLHPDGLTLWTFQWNARARRFYETRGFAASEFNDGSRNEEHKPDVLYKWRPRLLKQQ